MENTDNKVEGKNPAERNRQEIHSQVIRAGKRTYFFDVKSTRNEEYYLTITESKKKFFDNGKFHYEKHKVFLYPEDFHKFAQTLEDVIGFIQENQPELKSDRAEPAAEPKAEATAAAEPEANDKAETDNEPEKEEVPVETNGDGKKKDFTDIDFEDI
ncbi:MAG: PUR family DNA/RNA-binding protein [Prolixibacteraceae bacterium]|nr:PUR family DNA/RNA-binding protein [Prolixibacteraceae bacterium]